MCLPTWRAYLLECLAGLLTRVLTCLRLCVLAFLLVLYTYIDICLKYLRSWCPRLSYLPYIWKVKIQKLVYRKICFSSTGLLKRLWYCYPEHIFYLHPFYLYRYQLKNLHLETNLNDGYEVNSNKQEVSDNLSGCMLNILPKVRSLPSIIAVSLMKVKI